ncbi:MAG: hypothetical protein K0S06_863 [Microvirga sp.]|jgi:hypothetical protein|nr:hypothetical protein [Microvirga sp.]
MRAKAILCGAAAAMILALGALSSATASHRGHGHGPGYHGAAPSMHGGYHHGRMRPSMHGRVDHGRYREGYGMRHHGHHSPHRRHHGYGGHDRHHAFAGRTGIFPRPHYRSAYREHGDRDQGYFPRPRMHRRAFYGGGYGYRPSYRERPFFPAQARLAYDQPPEMDYGYPAYPIISYGTIAGGSAYAPLYNRPAWTCY